MSTKIYNGYKIATSNFEELFQFSISMRDSMRELANAEYKKLLIRKALWNLIDIQFFNKKNERKASPIALAYFDIADRKRKIKKTGTRDPLHDFDCSWVFIPVLYEKYSLALLYSDRKEYKELWEKHELISSYWYWNNTDPDEDVSEEDWKKREDDWETTLGNEPPCSNGFAFEVYGEYSGPKMLTKDDMKQSDVDDIFDRDVFADHIVNDLLFSDFVEMQKAEGKSETSYYSMRDFKEKLKTSKELKKNQKKYEKRVENELPECYTLDDLYEVHE